MAWPTTVLDLLVEIYVGGAWTDITSYVRRRGGQGIAITDGTQGTQQRRASPSQMNLEINNRDGRFSPRNPASPYFGLLTINTEIRCSAEGYYQFWGEVASGWPTKWTTGAPDTGDAWVPLRAGGRSERINADTTALDDPLIVAALDDDTYYPSYYWPLTDPASAASAASGVDNSASMIYSTAMTPFGERGPVFAGATAPPGLLTTPDFSSQGRLTARLTGAVLGDFQVVIWFKLESGDTSGFGAMSLYQLAMDGTPTGFDVIMYAGLGSGTPGLDRATFVCSAYTGSPPADANRSASTVLTVTGTPCAQAEWHELRVTYTASGGAVTQDLYLDGTLRGTDSGSALGYTLAAIKQVSLNAGTSGGAYAAAYTAAATGVGLASLASVAIYHGTPADPGTYEAGLGYAGETAGERLQRLCDENGITITFAGDKTLTSTMTAQRAGSTLASLFDDCARTDGGILTDARDSLGTRYVTRIELYTSATALALDYTLQAEIMPGLDVDESSLVAENDVTATSDAGTAHAEQLTGPRNVTEPNAGTGGIGRYPVPYSSSLDTQLQLDDAANWAVWLGTTDVPRFTSIPVSLVALAAAGKTALWQAAAQANPGDVITITNTPIWVPDDVRCFIVGRSVTMANKEFEIKFNTVDASAWQNIGGPLEDTVYGRLDSEDSVLHLALTSGATGALVANIGGERTPTLWTHADGDYAIQIDDEIMTVTAVSTVTKSLVATGTAAYADNASVTPGLPGGTTAGGHLMVLFAAARSTTTVVACPAGWTELDGFFGNELVAVRVHTGSESAPTVTFSGGAAGDTHGAVITSFEGLQARHPEVLDGTGTAMIAAFATNTGTSQNIDVSALEAIRDTCAIMQFGMKQDDWTSVATLSGTSEVYDGSSVLGSDMGLVWDWRTQTTATAVAAQSFVVTGGSSALWDSCILIIDGNVQQFTITRGVDGTTAAAHAIGSQVRLAYPLRPGR